MPPELIAFCGVAALLVVTPGPDMALVARNALVAGRSAVPITVLGIYEGDSEWMLGPARRFAGGGAFRQGFVSNVLNPKLVVFFISVLPGFTSPDGSFFAQVVVLGLVFELLTIIWLLSCGAGVARIGEAMRRPGVRQVLERISGSVLIALGLKVALDGSSELQLN